MNCEFSDWSWIFKSIELELEGLNMITMIKEINRGNPGSER